MRRLLLTIGLCLCTLGVAMGQTTLVDYSFTGDSGDPTSIEPGLSSTTLSLSSGTIGFGTASSSDWTGSGVPYVNENGGWIGLTSGIGKYYTFTITTDGSDSFDLSNISFLHRATSSGPSAMTVIVDGSEVSTINVLDSETTEYNEALSITGATSVEVRIIGWNNASRVTTGGGDFRLDDIQVEGTVDLGSNPILTVSESSLEDFGYAEGNGPSNEKSFTVSGVNLTDDIKVESTSNYEISTGAGGSFVSSSPITLSEASGEVAETTLYIRLKSGFTISAFTNDSITVSSSGADSSFTSLSGEVVEPFSISYSNDFQAQEDYDLAILQGITATTTDVRTGYLKIDNGQYIETPTIDFTSFDYIQVSFELEDFGGSSGQEFSVLISDDDGSNYDDTLSTNSVPSSYTSFVTEIDLTGTFDVGTGKLRFEMTDGTNSTRFRNLEINELYATSITGTEGWRLISIPKTNATGADISDDGIGAQFTSDTDSATVYIYDDTGSFEAISSDATTIADGLGLAIYFFDNTVNGSSELPLILDVSGNEPVGNVDVILNSGSANLFTLVGNPYSSNYNTNTILETGGSISDNISFWNNGTGSYSAQDRTTDYIVAPWQGFWVETADASITEISFDATGKTSSAASGTFFSKEVSNRTDIPFTLSSQNSFDEAIKLAFRSYATADLDRADATKLVPLKSEYATMAFNSNGKLKSVESLPYDLTEEIQLDLEENLVGVSGEFTLEWNGMESLPSGWNLTFHDYQEGSEIDMKTFSSYSFNAESSTSAKARSVLQPIVAETVKGKKTGRFGITITPGTSVSNDDEISTPTEFSLEQNYPNPFNPSTTIKYAVAENGPVNITIYNVMGQKVAELLNTTKNSGNYQITWDASGVSSGIYYYRLTTPSKVLTRQMTLIK